MNITERLRKSIASIVEIALNAPSVHNTQPWAIHCDNDICKIIIDKSHQLRAGDPTGRQTIISLGIFVEAIIIAAKQFNLSAKKIWYENDSAYIKFEELKSNKSNNAQINNLKSRATDRSVYELINIDKKDLSAIEKAYQTENTKIWTVNSKKDIELIAKLTSKGISVALSSPDFRNELSKYLVIPWSKKKRGISTSSLYISPIFTYLEPLLMKLGIGINAESNLEYKRWISSSAIILITTKGDMPEYWFDAGRCYLQVALKVEKLGLSQATSAATVEASNYHEDVEKIIQTNQRLQCVLRIGKGVKKRRRSPRVSASELIT